MQFIPDSPLPHSPAQRRLTATCATALLCCLQLLPAHAQEYRRQTDMLGTGISLGNGNTHASLPAPHTSVWSYWLLPPHTPLTDQSNWLPLPNTRSLEFRNRLTAASPDHHFILHDYRMEPQTWHLYWNRKDGQHSPYERAAMLAVFTAPQAGTYTLHGGLSWQHWPGPELRDGTIEIWQKDGRRENLLASAALVSAQAAKVFTPVQFDKAVDGRTLRLSKGSQIILRAQSSRSSYRGITIDDSGFSISGPQAQPVADEQLQTVILARQLETLLHADVAELSPMRAALAEGNFAMALEQFRNAFTELNARMRSPVHPPQWLFSPTTAQDLRNHSIHTIVYGEAQRHRFDIGAPGEVIWDKIGIGKYPYLLRDLPTMHWANALAQSVASEGPASDARLWIGYWADLASRWPQMHEAMLRDRDLRSLLIRDSLAWTRKAPLYFGWRLNNFFSWLPDVSRSLDRDDYSQMDAADLARTLIWFTTDEIPLAIETLQAPGGVPNQRRLLANGLLEASASLQWFKSTPDSVAAVREFIRQMAKIEMLPDGGSMEQSLNYNKHLPGEIDSLLITNANLPASLQFSADEVRFLERARSYRYAMMNALLDPQMQPPSIGKNNPYVFFDTWPEDLSAYPVSHAINEAFKGNTGLLDFTSVYFPWSGYAALRTDWSGEAAYAVFQNSRAGLGHHRESALHLGVSAYGKRLLVTSGAEQYSMTRNFDAYFQSSVAQNTISVDGYSQLAQKGGPPPDYNKPINARWLSSALVDYAEGAYTGPYGGWNYQTDGNAKKRDLIQEATPEIFDVKHERRVVFFRKMGIWVVVDRVHSDQKRQFTQSWNFSELFTEADISVDPENETITATLPEGPSVTLLQASSTEPAATYKIYYGVHTADTILGWVSKDSAPKAYDFAAAPDVHRLWESSGTQSLITIIAATPAAAQNALTHQSERSADSIKLAMQTKDGSTLSVTVNNATNTLIAEATAAGHSASVHVSEDSAQASISLGTSAPITLPISQPAGFKWTQTNGKWHPDYAEANTATWGQ